MKRTATRCTGPMNLGGQTLTNGTLSTGIKIEAASEIVNTPIRGVTAGTANQITVPTDGVSRAQAGGLPIVCLGDPINAFTVGMIIMFGLPPGDLPFGWHVCDGGTYNGNTTPDLRDSFILGAGRAYALGANGDVSIVSGVESPALTPTINPVTLSMANLAAHAHPFDYFFGNATPVVGIPGFAQVGGYYLSGGTPGGSRVSFAGTNTGTGQPSRPPQRCSLTTRTRFSSVRFMHSIS